MQCILFSPCRKPPNSCRGETRAASTGKVLAANAAAVTKFECQSVNFDGHAGGIPT